MLICTVISLITAVYIRCMCFSIFSVLRIAVKRVLIRFGVLFMRKAVIACICVILCLASVVTCVAVYYGFATEKHGEQISETVNRVNFSFSDTEQQFEYNKDGYMAEVEFSASKTEADFYAEMHSFSVEGMDYDRAEIIPVDSEDGDNPVFEGAVLPASDGKPQTVKWIIRIYFKGEKNSEFMPVINIDYLSGVKKNVCDRRLYSCQLKLEILP